MSGTLSGGKGEVYFDAILPTSASGGVTGVLTNGREDSTGNAGTWSLTATAICAQ